MPDIGYHFAVDLDGVCGDYVAALRPVVAAELGCPASDLPEPTEWDLTKVGWGIESDEDMIRIQQKAVVDPEWEIFRRMAPIPGAVEALQALSSMGVHIHILTARMMPGLRSHAKVAGDTQEWLDRHRIPYRSITFTEDKTKVLADIYIDDSPAQVLRLRAAGRRAIVFDQLYNRRVQGLRADGWPQASRAVREDLARWQTSGSQAG